MNQNHKLLKINMSRYINGHFYSRVKIVDENSRRSGVALWSPSCQGITQGCVGRYDPVIPTRSYPLGEGRPIVVRYGHTGEYYDPREKGSKHFHFFVVCREIISAEYFKQWRQRQSDVFGSIRKGRMRSEPIRSDPEPADSLVCVLYFDGTNVRPFPFPSRADTHRLVPLSQPSSCSQWPFKTVDCKSVSLLWSSRTVSYMAQEAYSGGKVVTGTL